MQHTAKTGGFPAFGQHVETLGPGVAAMNDERELGGAGEFHLIAEGALLNIARRMVVEIVETDFTPGDYLGMQRETGECVEVCRSDFPSFVRMDADGGVDPVVRLG